MENKTKGRRFLDTLFPRKEQPKKVEQPKEETVQPVQQSNTNRLAYKQQNIQALAMPLSMQQQQ